MTRALARRQKAALDSPAGERLALLGRIKQLEESGATLVQIIAALVLREYPERVDAAQVVLTHEQAGRLGTAQWSVNTRGDPMGLVVRVERMGLVEEEKTKLEMLQ